MVEDYAHGGKAPDGLHHFKACEIIVELVLLAEFVFRADNNNAYKQEAYDTVYNSPNNSTVHLLLPAPDHVCLRIAASRFCCLAIFLSLASSLSLIRMKYTIPAIRR